MDWEKELAEEIKRISKRYPEISFAKLSRIAVRVAKWQREQFKKNNIAFRDNLTRDDYVMGVAFVDKYIKEKGRVPTFFDAINYGIEWQKEFEKSLPKIKGWVARDKENDPWYGTGLIFHLAKPCRTGNEWSSKTISMHLPWDMFPNLKWEDEPVEVELLIRECDGKND